MSKEKNLTSLSYVNKIPCTMDAECSNGVYYGPAIDRLYEFEKIGMEPEDLASMAGDYPHATHELAVAKNAYKDVQKENKDLRKEIDYLVDRLDRVEDELERVKEENNHLCVKNRELKVSDKENKDAWDEVNKLQAENKRFENLYLCAESCVESLKKSKQRLWKTTEALEKKLADILEQL